jgi:hypothetical protein
LEIDSGAPPIEVTLAIAASGFGQPMSEELRADVKAHLGSGELVYTLRDQGRPIGFAIFNVWGADRTILYLSGVILESSCQGRGALPEIIARARRDAPTVQYFALRTQSPRMWSAALRLCDRWYPNPQDGLKVPGPYAEVGQLVATNLDSSFPQHPGCYSGPLYGAPPLHRDPRLQAWWNSICNGPRGDAVICVGKFTG